MIVTVTVDRGHDRSRSYAFSPLRCYAFYKKEIATAKVISIVTQGIIAVGSYLNVLESMALDKFVKLLDHAALSIE